MNRSVLVVDDEELIRRSLRMALEGAGYAVRLAASGAEALACVAAEMPDCALIDLRLGDLDGLEVLRRAREDRPTLKAIVITAHGDVESAVGALRLGAFDFIRKPFDLEEVIASVKNALRTDELERQVAYYSDRASDPDLIYDSEAMHAVMGLVRTVATQPVPMVLIRGESGTGKELIARALHERGPRASAPFIALNCGAIPETLIDSELFGHTRGAFTGATAEPRRGVRGGRRRHPVPRRDRRHAPCGPGPAPARAAGAARSGRSGRAASCEDRRTRGRGHQRRPRGRGRARAVPPGPASSGWMS